MGSQDKHLKKTMGYWSLTATSLGSIIGSGWLFGSMYAAQSAGPESIISWIIGGISMLLVGLGFAELGMVKPESGGLVRYPMYSNGSLVATIVGWGLWLGFVANPATEAAGILQYASHYLPGVYVNGRLTTSGILIAVGLLIIFVVINYFGVKIFAKTNNVITALKFIVPTVTILTIFVAGFRSSNFSQYGGFAPYGWTAGLGCIATSGIIYAYTGFRNVIDLSGEARNPRKNVPRALISSILITIVLYVVLEIVFLGGTPTHSLSSGWKGVNFNSPYADLALSMNMMWLYWLIIADSILSPAGTSIVFTASNARNVFGLAKNGFFPRYFEKVNQKYGIPTRALILNFIVGILFLLPLPSWQAIIQITTTLVVFTFSAGCVSVMVFRRTGITKSEYRFAGMNVIAPIAFMISTLIIFWEPWPKLRLTLPILLVGIILYVFTYIKNQYGMHDLRAGIWIIVYLIAIFILSKLGTFGGSHAIASPWDSIIVAAISLVIYFWAVSSGVRFMTHKDDPFAIITDSRDHT